MLSKIVDKVKKYQKVLKGKLGIPIYPRLRVGLKTNKTNTVSIENE